MSSALVGGMAFAGHRGKPSPAPKCHSSKISCRPSVHHGTGCSGGGCDCHQGEICAPDPHASKGSPFSGQCLCG